MKKQRKRSQENTEKEHVRHRLYHQHPIHRELPDHPVIAHVEKIHIANTQKLKEALEVTHQVDLRLQEVGLKNVIHEARPTRHETQETHQSKNLPQKNKTANGDRQRINRP